MLSTESMSSGKVYIIPIPISEDTFAKVLPDYNASIILTLRYFVVERTKTARQFLRKMDREFPIDASSFFEYNKHDDYSFAQEAVTALKEGHDIGLISEAGYPGIADPGANFVAAAHKVNAQVIPLIGPSSIFLALAASGMNGQGFSFHGYPPIKDPERSMFLRKISESSEKTNYAQILIETPYRNEKLLQDFIKYANNHLELTIAYDVTGKNEEIITKPLSTWKKKPFNFDKTPCVFILGTTQRRL